MSSMGTSAKRPSVEDMDVDAAGGAKAKQVKQEDERLPVTVLSGFLGAGKTTIVKALLQNKEGMKIAIIVNDMAAINIDEQEILRTTTLPSKVPKQNPSNTKPFKKEKAIKASNKDAVPTEAKDEAKVVALQNGCICCSIRKDLILQVQELAQSTAPKFDYLVIESSGISEPAPVAMTFCHSLDELRQMAADHASTQPDDMSPEERTEKNLAICAMKLQKKVRLDTMVTVADGSELLQTLGARTQLKDSNMKHQLHTEEECENPEDHHQHENPNRPLADLLVEQLEFANVVLLTKRDKLEKEKGAGADKQTEALVNQLNPKAKILWTTFGKVYSEGEDSAEASDQATRPNKESNISAHILNTKQFSLDEVSTSQGWLQELNRANNVDLSAKGPKDSTIKTFRTIGHSPKAFGVASIVYRSARPFHPQRLHDLMEGMGTMDLGAKSTKCGARPAEVNAEKPLLNVIRSKGQIWVANCSAVRLDWHSVGRSAMVAPGTPFQSALKEAGMDEDSDSDSTQADSTQAAKKSEEIKKKVEKNSDEEKSPWGDRSTELVLIGVDLDKEFITQVLDKTLVSEEEWAKACAEKRKFDLIPEDTDFDISEVLPTFCNMPDPFFGGDAGMQFMMLREEQSGDEQSGDEQSGEEQSGEEQIDSDKKN